MKDKNNIDELLNSYIDDELSPRQQTEIKRLIMHDNDISEKLQQLKMCKALVSALPCEEAPYNMLEDIKSALERKTLLQETPKHFQKNEGNRYLHMRKILASAAMISLFAVLGTIIYSVLSPDKSDSTSVDWKHLTKPVAKNSAIKPTKAEVATKPKPQSMIANITLETDEFIATNAFIRKTIEEHGLLNKTAPVNPEESGLYYLSSSIGGMNLLLANLGYIEQRFKNINLKIASAYSERESYVENLSFKQIHEIINQSNFDESVKAAHQIAALNYVNERTQGGNALASILDKNTQSLTIPKPVLTSGDRALKPSVSVDDDKNKVYLMIKLVSTK